jgi:hypothetical protein
VTDRHLPYPYGREITGYQVANLAQTLAKAKAAGVLILVRPYTADRRDAAMLQFPGGLHRRDPRARIVAKVIFTGAPILAEYMESLDDSISGWYPL